MFENSSRSAVVCGMLRSSACQAQISLWPRSESLQFPSFPILLLAFSWSNPLHHVNMHECIELQSLLWSALNVFLSMQKLFSCMPFFPSPSGERTCSSSEFTCPIWYPGHPRCVPLNFVCDGERDCVNAADELQNCANRTCHMDEFACSNGLCILIPYQ